MLTTHDILIATCCVINKFCYILTINVFLLICNPPQNSLLLHLVETEYWDFWAVVQIHYRCSHLPNATQWDVPDAPTVTESAFGRSEVESRLNVSQKEHSHYHTLECVASLEGAEAYTLFSISGTMAWGSNTPAGAGEEGRWWFVLFTSCMHTNRKTSTQTHWPWARQGQVCS